MSDMKMSYKYAEMLTRTAGASSGTGMLGVFPLFNAHSKAAAY